MVISLFVLLWLIVWTLEDSAEDFLGLGLDREWV